MPEEFRFQFTKGQLPQGEALTAQEIENRLKSTLESRDGKCAESLQSLTVLYQQLGRLDEAVDCMQRVIELAEDPEEIGAGYLALGQLEESRHDYARAASRYREALALEPCSTRTWYFIHNNLGYSLNQINEHAQAIPFLQRAIEINPGLPNAYKNLGLAQQALGNLHEAAELFLTATQVNATDSRSLQHLIELVQANPTLQIDIPNLAARIAACTKAVEFARKAQPNFQEHWAQLRAKQQRKWWQFWKRRTDAKGN